MKVKVTWAVICGIFFSWTTAHADPVRAVVNTADKAFAEQRYDAAARAYRHVLEALGPDETGWTPYVKYRLGRVQLIQGNAEEALKNMEPFYRLKPETPFVVRDYACALFANKRYREAIPVFENAAAMNKTFEPEARCYIGASRIAIGDPEGGAKDLKKVADTAAPGSTDAKRAEELLAGLEKALQDISLKKQAAVTAVPGRPTKEKPWAASFSLGMEYDSNVGLIPSDQTRPEDVSSKGDWRAVHALSGIYEFTNTGNQLAGVSLGAYGTHQFQDDEFNVENGFLSLYYKVNAADAIQFRVRPFVSKTWLEAASHNLAWGVTPGVSYQPVHWTWTDLDYTFSNTDFTDAPLYPEEDRDGKNHTAILRQNFSFPSLLIDKRITYFGTWVFYGKSDTEGDSYDSTSRGVGVQAQQEFQHDFTLLVTYAYAENRFENVNIRSATNEKRDDSDHLISTTVFKRLPMIYKSLSAYAGWRRYKNDSNIDRFFSYSSNTYSLGLMIHF